MWLPGTGLEHLSLLCALLMQALSLSTDWTWLAESCLQRLVPTILATVILLLSASRLPPSKFILESFAFCCYAYCTLHMYPSISLLSASLFLQASRYWGRLSASVHHPPARHLSMNSFLLLASSETTALQCRRGSGQGS